MRLPRRFGDAVSSTTCQRQAHRAGQVDLMSRRNVDRLGSLLRSHDAPDDLVLVSQRRDIADVWTRFIMLAREPSLRAAESRDAKPQSGMARQSDAARMGPALAVEHHRVG